MNEIYNNNNLVFSTSAYTTLALPQLFEIVHYLVQCPMVSTIKVSFQPRENREVNHHCCHFRRRSNTLPSPPLENVQVISYCSEEREQKISYIFSQLHGFETTCMNIGQLVPTKLIITTTATAIKQTTHSSFACEFRFSG